MFLKLFCFFFLVIPPPSSCTLFPYTTLFRSRGQSARRGQAGRGARRRTPADSRGVWHRQSSRTLALSHVRADDRSEEHTSELQSRFDLVCRLLLEKKKHSKCWY